MTRFALRPYPAKREILFPPTAPVPHALLRPSRRQGRRRFPAELAARLGGLRGGETRRKAFFETVEIPAQENTLKRRPEGRRSISAKTLYPRRYVGKLYEASSIVTDSPSIAHKAKFLAPIPPTLEGHQKVIR